MAADRSILPVPPPLTDRFAWHVRDSAQRQRDPHGLDGVWWPESRELSDELGMLFAAWPPAAGRIMRVMYSPPDWADRPKVVQVPGRRVKVDGFPGDDTRTLVVTVMDWSRLRIRIVPPSTSPAAARELLDEIGAGKIGEEGSSMSGWQTDGGQNEPLG